MAVRRWLGLLPGRWAAHPDYFDLAALARVAPTQRQQMQGRLHEAPSRLR